MHHNYVRREHADGVSQEFMHHIVYVSLIYAGVVNFRHKKRRLRVRQTPNFWNGTLQPHSQNCAIQL